jgi:hypothetical protein
LSPAASKKSDAEAEPTEEEEYRDKTRGEIEVLILVVGLLMSPQFYLWSSAVANIQSIAVPIWQDYLQTQLGSPPYSPNDMIALYFTPFSLLGLLPIDIMLFAYDISIIVGIVALVLLGFALIEIESGDVKRIRTLVQEGRTCFSAVLLLLTFFTVFHLLNNLMLPFKPLLRPFQTWTTFGIALLTAIGLIRLLTTHMRKVVGTPHQKTPQVDSVSTEA